MTLLGVGAGASGKSGGATTLGGIGTGYIYPAWKGQISYTTPNMNGFSATIGIMNPNNIPDGVTTSTANTIASLNQDRFGIEGQVMYAFSGDIAGKVWASGASYDVTRISGAAEDSYTATAYDVGAAVSSGNFGLVAYYYDGDGAGTTLYGNLGVDANGKKRNSDGGYIQATYVIPTGTKLGVAYGESNLDKATAADTSIVDKNERWTVGAYHPLTKHLNLVAEYNKVESEAHNNDQNENDSFSLGAILFF
jgi:hypothetical protein